jgi:Protein of unknown function (DUF1588)/Protein of unknown function (DUF1592)/Protein of unknown function (DUF1595)
LRWGLAIATIAFASCTSAARTSPTPAPEPSGIAKNPDALPTHVRPMLRRLGAREYVVSVRALTGIEIDRKKLAPLDVARRFDNGDPDTWVTSDVLAATENVAWELATKLQAERPEAVFGTCETPEACTEMLLGSFLPKLFRRPLSSEERASYTSFTGDAIRAEGASEGLRMLLARALQSPAFLYREEVGTLPQSTSAPQDGPMLRTLTPFEIASSLAFFITGETPDAELQSAAVSGSLTKPEARAAQTERLWDTEPARAQRQRFFQEYLAVKQLRLLRKDKKAVPDWSIGLKPPGQVLSDDLDRFLADVVAQGGSVEALLTQAGTLSLALPTTYRSEKVQGVLTHPGFLAAHGGYEDSGPIGRGVFVLSRLLCSTPPPPPPGIPRTPSEGPEGNTTRARFSAHSQDASCQGCHQAIDGAGFGFERYDGAGRYRTQENGLPIDATGAIALLSKASSSSPGAKKVEQSYNGIFELSKLLAVSSEVSSCMGRYYLRFAFGGERAAYAPLFDRLSVSTDPRETLRARTLTLVQDAAFVTRSEGSEP